MLMMTMLLIMLMLNMIMMTMTMLMILLMMMLMMMQVESPILDYKQQVEALTAAGFALWDVVQKSYQSSPNKMLSYNRKTQKMKSQYTKSYGQKLN